MNSRTRAVLSPDGKHYLLTGEKMWITNAHFADLFTVFAKIDGEKFTAFLVEKDFPGFSVGNEEKKMGIRGSSTAPLILNECKVPVDNVLGEIGKGHIIAFNILNVGRFKLGASCVGGARTSLQHSIAYAKERKAFGKSIAEFGLIREKLAQMAAGIYASESMVYRTVGMMDTALSAIEHNPETVRKAIECCNEVRAPPTQLAPSLKRPTFRMLNAMMCPLPISPSTFSTGTLHSFRMSGAVEEPRMPIFFSSLPTAKPGKSFSTRKAVNFSPSILAKTVNRSAKWAFVIHIFSPVRR